jgi:hypothetical protein
MRLIASANSGATVNTRILGIIFSGGSGIVSVTAMLVTGAFLSRSMAFPHNTPCVAAM